MSDTSRINRSFFEHLISHRSFLSSLQVNKVELDANKILVNKKMPQGDNLSKEEQQELELFPWTAEACKERMDKINQYVKDVSSHFNTPSTQTRASSGLHDL